MEKNKLTIKEILEDAVNDYKARNLEKSEISCHKILSIDSDHFPAKLLLANISAQKKDFKKAKKLLEEVNEIQPNNPGILNNLGTACKELKELSNAIIYYKKVIEIDPKNINAYYNLGTTSYQLKDLKEAQKCLQKTILLQPNFALAFFILGNIHVDLKEYDTAISNYKKALEINKKLAGAHNNLGLVYRLLNDFENAIDCYEKVIKIKPDHAPTHHNLALLLKEMGKFDKAVNSHEMAIKYEPENLTHYFYLSELKKDILDSALKNKIGKALKNEKSTKNNLASGNFLLSKYEKKNKNYEDELNYLTEGHKQFFLTQKNKFELGIKYYFDDVLQVSEGVKIEEIGKKSDIQLNPIFIIGVPRCGSTLVEKIAGSGSKFIPMGEETGVLENFLNKKIVEKKSLNLGNIGNVQEELLSIYKNKGLVFEKYNYTFTDKSLNNFFYLNLIKTIYPNAKVINCQRNVLSSIISIFQNNLTELSWTHNLDNIFKYFDNYFHTINKFKKMFPNFIYDLNFENLSNNPEEESKNLMKFCNLPWDPKCLEFYKRKDLISKTASNVQIRQGIYKHSLDKYSPYKKLLTTYGKKYSWFN